MSTLTPEPMQPEDFPLGGAVAIWFAAFFFPEGPVQTQLWSISAALAMVALFIVLLQFRRGPRP
jgi:hypothetical protein